MGKVALALAVLMLCICYLIFWACWIVRFPFNFVGNYFLSIAEGIMEDLEL